MKKVLLITAALAMFATSAFAAGGQLYLAWGNCNGGTGASGTATFACLDGVGGTMYIDYKLNTAAVGIVTLNAILDVNVNDVVTLPDFWHFEDGGCNAGYLVLNAARASGKCTTSGITLCTSTGAACSAFITAYGIGAPAGLPAENRARILVTLARSASSPVNLTVAKQYGFSLEINATNAMMQDLDGDGEYTDPPLCAGCDAVASVALNAIVLEAATLNASGEAVADVITSDMAGSVPSVCGNSATCLSVPVKNKTWGQLKALYR